MCDKIVPQDMREHWMCIHAKYGKTYALSSGMFLCDEATGSLEVDGIHAEYVVVRGNVSSSMCPLFENDEATYDDVCGEDDRGVTVGVDYPATLGR